jgi:hypothetical protein
LWANNIMGSQVGTCFGLDWRVRSLRQFCPGW